jgi:hypothetical protein
LGEVQVKDLAKVLSRVVEVAKDNPELAKAVVSVLRAVLGSDDPVEAGKRAALAAGAKAAYRAR